MSLSIDVQAIKSRRSFSTLERFADLMNECEVSAIEQEQINTVLQAFGKDRKDHAIGLAALLVAGTQAFLQSSENRSSDEGTPSRGIGRGRGGRRPKSNNDMIIGTAEAA